MTIQKAEMPPGRKRTKTAAPSPSRMDRDEDQGEVAWKNNKGNPPGKRGESGLATRMIPLSGLLPGSVGSGSEYG